MFNSKIAHKNVNFLLILKTLHILLLTALKISQYNIKYTQISAPTCHNFQRNITTEFFINISLNWHTLIVHFTISSPLNNSSIRTQSKTRA